MDYKELIEKLDAGADYYDGDLLDAAATAIETLLGEREALIKLLEQQSGMIINPEILEDTI